MSAGADSELRTILRREIEDKGPLSFSRFQEIALYHPTHGYYSRVAGIGTEGADYWTAPEMDPVFGELLGVQVSEMAQCLGEPTDFTVVEYGAGTGAMAASMLEAWRRERHPLYRSGLYRIVEPSPVLRERQQQRLSVHGDVVIWGCQTPGPQRLAAGVIVMNEVLDAMPVDRVIGHGRELQEIRIGLDADGELQEVLVPAASECRQELERRLPATQTSLASGQEAEIRPGLEAFVSGATKRIGSGYMLVIDYGYTNQEMYLPIRRRGTVLAYYRHQATEAFLDRIGLQDITAHVDFTALSTIARQLGFEEAGLTTQMKFLMALGLGERLAALDQEPMDERLRTHRRLRMTSLVKPGGMGDIFKVWVGARRAPSDLKGLRNPFARQGR